jgi:hypothetical protein
MTIETAICTMTDLEHAHLAVCSSPLADHGARALNREALELSLTLFKDMDYEGRSRSPQQHPADRRLDYSRDQDAQYRSRDRDDYRNRTSRSPPRRGRQSYRDRDREGYQSPGYSHSRSRSPRGGKSHFGQESREVMMDGIPQDMTEDDVSSIYSWNRDQRIRSGTASRIYGVQEAYMMLCVAGLRGASRCISSWRA